MRTLGVPALGKVEDGGQTMGGAGVDVGCDREQLETPSKRQVR